jgi:hypothetical protein
MKTKSKNTWEKPLSKSCDAPAAAQIAAPIDPATQRPIARDLRFHHRVAHQREFYFLNQNYYR